MENKVFNKTALDNILTELRYYENFQNNYLQNKFENIDYGVKMGKLFIKKKVPHPVTFDNLFDAEKKYTYSGEVGENVFFNWNQILNKETSTEEEILCAILEIFVWGNVLSGNVKTAIKLYKDKKLKHYIRQITEHLKRKEILSEDFKNELGNEKALEIIWSSGWTKVYSFINNSILIYDSRVSAFLNHTLTHKTNYTEEQLENLKRLTKYLFNFKGAESRERLVDKKPYGFKNSNPNGVNGFNANLISSWTVELLNEKLKLNKEIRSFERAFFMLGFDLKQIKQGQGQ